MFDTIMIPVDLAHEESLERALGVAAALARTFDATPHLVGVTAVTPTELAHTPREYRERLERFAAARSEAFGVRFGALALESHDPTIDLDRHLRDAADTLGADLIVMSSHVPHFAEWLVHSHARWLAAHTTRSVFIVR